VRAERIRSTTAYEKRLSAPALTELVRWLMRRLFSEDLVPLISTPLEAAAWEELVTFLVDQRVAGILAEAVADGLPATPSQRDHARSLHHAAVVTDLRVERALLSLAGRLDGAHVEWRVIKGVAAARLLHPNPEVRSTGDVDVLVHPRDFDRATECIRRWADVVDDYPEHGPASALVAGGHTFITASGIELDVHRTVRGSLARFEIPTAPLFERPTMVRVQRTEVNTPPIAVVILHAMLHLGKDGGRPGEPARLSNLLDLMVARVRHDSEYRRAAELAARCGCAVPAAWADEVVRKWLPCRVAPVLPSTPHRSVWMYDRIVSRSGLASALRRLEGPRRGRRAWEALMPSSTFREHHGLSRFGRLGYVRGRLTGADRRSDRPRS
jgi:hypothetical protein